METENIYTPINYGFDPNSIVVEPDQYVFGGLSSLPKEIIQPDRQWDDSLPDYEPQFGPDWDSFGCTIWGTENAQEILEYKISGVKKNYSERAVYIGTRTRPPGNNPHRISEWIRDNGLVDEAILPFTATFKEFITPDPLPEDIVSAGKKWRENNEYLHEWVFTNFTPKERRKALMMENLQYSPLGVSVTSWFEEDGVFIDKGLPNSHWCVCYGFTDRGWKIFDSYNHSKKIYSFDSEISFCKRYYWKPITSPYTECCWLKRILNLCPVKR